MTKNKDQIEYDLTGSQDSSHLIDEVEELEKRVFLLEKIIRDNELGHLLEQSISDEEYICVKGIDSVKKLATNESLTKDDVAMFDTLDKNLNTIRGIQPKKEKKEKPKSRDELISIIKGGAK